jgi:adenylate cyclase
MREQRKLAAIMFTDISGYSAMMAKDEKQAMEILRKNRSIHKSAITRFNGQYIKEIGDGTLAIFQSSLDAVNCAFRILKSCCKESNLAVRIGIHIGDIVFKDGDVFGDGVNIASRIEAVGLSGGIYISERVYEDIKNKAGIRAEFHDQKLLKNIPDPVNIYQIMCADSKTAEKVSARTGIRIRKSESITGKHGVIWKYALPFMVLLSIAAFIFYPKVFKEDRLEMFRKEGHISVAVMPFQNLTLDSEKNFWQLMIQDNLINSLSNSRDLKVRQSESILNVLQNDDNAAYASINPSLARQVSRKLNADVFVFGSIKQIGEIIRLNANLVDAETEEVFKSFQLDGRPEEILTLTDSLTIMVKDFLIVTILKKDLPVVDKFYMMQYREYGSTNSPEAFKYYIEGMKAFRKSNFQNAIKLMNQAIEIDPDFSSAKLLLPMWYGNLGLYEEAKKFANIEIQNKDLLSRLEKIWAEYNYAYFFQDPSDAIRCLRQLLEIDNQLPIVYNDFGYNYSRMGQYEKAIIEYEKALDIYKKWGTKPEWAPSYTNLGYAYHKTGQHKKEQKLYKQAEKDFPNNPLIIRRQAILALVRGKTKQADEYLAKFESIIRNEGASEALIQTRMGWIYEEAGMNHRAEDHFRIALFLEPKNPTRMTNLAYLLIEKDLNINEGADLIEKALEISPDTFTFLYVKGRGLYEQGKYHQALEILQKSWDLRREFSVYDHEAFLHLEEARKAVASFK